MYPMHLKQQEWKQKYILPVSYTHLDVYKRQELKHNAKQKVKEHVSIQVTKKYDKAFECVDEMSPEDLALLKERIAKAEALQKEKQEAEEDVEVEESEATTDSETSQVQEDETEQ